MLHDNDRIRSYYRHLLTQGKSPSEARAHVCRRFGIPAWQLPSILYATKAEYHGTNTPQASF